MTGCTCCCLAIVTCTAKCLPIAAVPAYSPLSERCRDILTYSHSPVCNSMTGASAEHMSVSMAQHPLQISKLLLEVYFKDVKNPLQGTAAQMMSICINKKAVASDHSLRQLAYPTGGGNCCELEGDVWLSGTHPVSGHRRGRLWRCPCHWLCQPQPDHGALRLLCGQS